MTMSGKSSVGTSHLYESGDQTQVPTSEIEAARRNKEDPGVAGYHGPGAHTTRSREHEPPSTEQLSKHDPTAPVSTSYQTRVKTNRALLMIEIG